MECFDSMHLPWTVQMKLKVCNMRKVSLPNSDTPLLVTGCKIITAQKVDQVNDCILEHLS